MHIEYDENWDLVNETLDQAASSKWYLLDYYAAYHAYIDSDLFVFKLDDDYAALTNAEGSIFMLVEWSKIKAELISPIGENINVASRS